MPESLKVKVGKRYQRSVNLVADCASDSAIRDFIVSPLALETLSRIVSGAAAPSGNRSWAIIGPYGSGKSSLAAFLTRLIAPGGATGALKRIPSSFKAEASLLKRSLSGIGAGLVSIPVVGERAPLAQVLVSALDSGLTALSDRRRGRPLAILADIRNTLRELKEGRTVADSSIVELFVEAAQAVESSKIPGAGLCVIVDEFGKTLEWAAQNPAQTDLYLLQLLAEATRRDKDGRLLLVTIQHQGLEVYSSRLSIQQQREWEKVAGRFETVPYLESPRHLVGLIGEAIEITGDKHKHPAWKEHQKAKKLLTAAAKGVIPAQAIDQSFPLHPTAALVLGPLFRLDLGQNERLLFSFLSSREPGAFQGFLSEWNSKSRGVELYTLEALYDYVLANTRAAFSTGIEGRTWGAAEEAIRRMPVDAGELEVQVIKTVAILSLVGPALGLAPTQATILASISTSPAALKAAIKRLETASILIFRAFKSSYQLWDGSDLDIGTLLQSGRDRVLERGDLAHQLGEIQALPPFLAARHYLETGTLRSFECQFWSESEYRVRADYQGTADGLICIVLPETGPRSETLLKERFLDGGRPILSLHLTETSGMVEAVLDLLAAREALRSTAELENDPIARRALEEIRFAAWERLQEQLTNAFHGPLSGEWRHNNNRVSEAGSLSDLATRALSTAYSQAPQVHTELLNRASLSSAAAAARRELLDRLLSHVQEENLGIEGHPPELSMYLSVLKAGKVHRPLGGVFRLASPPPKSPLHELWTSLEETFATGDGKRISLEQLYQKFSGPPFGAREGLLPLVVFCYLLVNHETAFLYEDGTFIPAIQGHHVQRFLSRPQTFEVQKLVLNDSARQALAAVGEAVVVPEGHGGLLPTVRALVDFANGLSGYARQTQRISAEARKLRATLLSARDPIQLLTNSIPTALGLSLSTKEMRSSLRDSLVSCMNELKEADQQLLTEIRQLLLLAFGRNSAGPVGFTSLRSRAESINLEAFQVQPLARVVMVMERLKDEAPADSWYAEIGLALVGKPVGQWRDDDLPLFRSVLFEAARQFAAAEAGSDFLNREDLSSQPLHGSVTSIAWINSSGGYDTTVTQSTPELAAKLSKALPKLEAIARQHGMMLRELLAGGLVQQAASLNTDVPLELEPSKH